MLAADPHAVREQLGRILASAQFRGAARQQAFLEFVVSESLEGRGHELKETLIAATVYNKPVDYDPRIDSTVRVEASKLGQRLQQYYEGPGASDRIVLSIPKGSYHLHAIDASAPAAPAGVQGGPNYWRVATFVMASLVAAVATWVIAGRGDPGALDPSRLRVNRITEPASFSTSPALSSNGEFTVYASDRETGGVLNLWRQPFAEGPPVRLTRSGFNHETPTVSPDGSMVIFRTGEEGGNLAWMPMAGGDPQLLKATAGGRNPRFSPNGKSLLYWAPRDEETGDYGKVFLLNAPPMFGHLPVQLFGDFAHATLPLWSESGKHVLAAGTWQSNVPDREFDAWLLTLDGMHAEGAPRKTGLFPALKDKEMYRTVEERSQVELAELRGEWLYLTIPTGESRDLFRIKLSLAEGRVAGDLQRLTFGAGKVHAARVSAHGRVIFARSELSYDLFSLRAPARSQPAEDLRRHTSETGVRLRTAIHSSGNAGVWEKRGPGIESQIWFFNLATGSRVKLGFGDDRIYSHALISPDGRLAAYRIYEPGLQPIYLQPVTGGPAKRVCDNCGTPSDWTADGRHLYFVTGGQPAKIGVLAIESGKWVREWIRHPSYSMFGVRVRLNSGGDGWLTFYGDNGPRTRQIYLVPMRNFDPAGQQDWIPVTDGAHWDQSPAWAPDGRILYYVNRHDGFACIMARALDASGRPEGAPWAVRHFHSPAQTLMRSVNPRGADALWVAGQRIFFMLDNRESDLWSFDLGK